MYDSNFPLCLHKDTPNFRSKENAQRRLLFTFCLRAGLFLKKELTRRLREHPQRPRALTRKEKGLAFYFRAPSRRDKEHAFFKKADARSFREDCFRLKYKKSATKDKSRRAFPSFIKRTLTK
jgi:hypothetical protein